MRGAAPRINTRRGEHRTNGVHAIGEHAVDAAALGIFPEVEHLHLPWLIEVTVRRTEIRDDRLCDPRLALDEVYRRV